MKLIKPSVEWWGACPSLPGQALRWIERAGRTCYKSEDKITDESAPTFVKNVTHRGHLSVIEHSNAVFRCSLFDHPRVSLDQAEGVIYSMLRKRGKYHDVKVIGDSLYIGGNLRAWLETIQWGLATSQEPSIRLRFVTEFWEVLRNLYPAIFPELHPHKECIPTFEFVADPPKEMQRYTVKWVCDRGVSHEIVRHRPCSFSQESTRYCDYNGKDMEFVEPAWWIEEQWDEQLEIEECSIYDNFTASCRDSEFYYREAHELGQSPQQARANLTNALKTEIVITADLEEWNWIFNLRDSAAAHPDMQILASTTKDIFMENELIPWEEK